MAFVDWSAGTIKPRKSNPNRRETVYPVTYDCGHTVELHASNARKAEAGQTAMCANCQRSAAGKIGYQVTVSKYGRLPLVKKMVEHQRANPSKLERTVKAWLESLSIEFVHVDILERGNDRYWTVDFRIKGTKTVIEVDGEWVHEQSKEADARKQAWLEHHDYKLVRIPEMYCTPDLLNHLYAAEVL